MKLRYRVACLVAVATAALISCLRLLGGDLYTSGLWVSLMAVVSVFLLCGFKPRAPLAVNGGFAIVTAAGAMLAGVSLLVSTLGVAVDLLDKKYPYPQPLEITAVNQLLLFVMIVGGLGGGLFFVLTGVRWLGDRKTDRRMFGGVALLPVVWSWARMIWYMFSFTSAVNRFTGLIELAMLVCEMLFMMTFARYVSGVEETTPRFTLPIALCAVLFGLTATVTHIVAFLRQDAALFGATALLSAPDIGVTVLALTWVIGQVFGKGSAAEALPMPVEEEPEVKAETPPPAEEEEETPFILSDEAFVVAEAEEDEVEEETPAEERRPLELEDIINEILSGKL